MDECKEILERIAISLEAIQTDIETIKKALVGGE